MNFPKPLFRRPSPKCLSSKTKKSFLLTALLGLSLAVVQDTQAAATRLPNQDPEAIARGNAFAATADNPSAIYYNPAGITQLEGQTISAGMYLISVNVEYTSPSGAKAVTDDKLQPVPQIYYVCSPSNSSLSFGLGIYAPYGLGVNWGTAPFNTLAQDARVLYATINPVVAWKIHETLSLAIGPTINYSQAEFNRTVGIVPNDLFHFKGNGMGYGFNAGLLWQPHEQWSVGVNYRYTTEVNYRGESEVEHVSAPRGTSASLVFPQFLVGGISYRPTEKWNLEFDVDWTDWDNVNQVVFKNTAFGNVPFVMNYQSGYMYEFGVERKLPNGYWAAVGYSFVESASPDRNFNPVVPDSDLNLGSFGLGRKGRRWDWALAYHFGSNGTGHVVKGSIPGGADGRYVTFNQAVNASIAFKF